MCRSNARLQTSSALSRRSAVSGLLVNYLHELPNSNSNIIEELDN